MTINALEYIINLVRTYIHKIDDRKQLTKEKNPKKSTLTSQRIGDIQLTGIKPTGAQLRQNKLARTVIKISSRISISAHRSSRIHIEINHRLNDVESGSALLLALLSAHRRIGARSSTDTDKRLDSSCSSGGLSGRETAELRGRL